MERKISRYGRTLTFTQFSCLEGTQKIGKTHGSHQKKVCFQFFMWLAWVLSLLSSKFWNGWSSSMASTSTSPSSIVGKRSNFLFDDSFFDVSDLLPTTKGVNFSVIETSLAERKVRELMTLQLSEDWAPWSWITFWTWSFASNINSFDAELWIRKMRL